MLLAFLGDSAVLATPPSPNSEVLATWMSQNSAVFATPLSQNSAVLQAPRSRKFLLSTKAPWSGNSAVLATLLSHDCTVLATPRSRFTVSFNKKPFHDQEELFSEKNEYKTSCDAVPLRDYKNTQLNYGAHGLYKNGYYFADLPLTTRQEQILLLHAIQTGQAKVKG